MPTSSNSSASTDQCEHCHSNYSFLKRKKLCAICQQSYCTTCAPRERHSDQTFRVCLICQLMSNQSTTEEQLSALKVKQLRNYLQAKNVNHETCTEKRDLVDLIVRHRQTPFSRLSTQEVVNQSPSSTRNGMENLQQKVSTFADQMNHFASNVQDYVSNTVADVMNQALGDPPPSRPASMNPSSNPIPPQPRRTTNTETRTAQPPPPSTQKPPESASGNTQRKQRKSISDLNTEENIEDLNIRELKEILAANFVDFKGCVEKNELIERVRRLYRDRQNEKQKAKDLDHATANDSEICKICMDAIADCVFLDCGHMVTCVQCGKILAECPICRSNIVRVVRVFKS